MADFDVAFVQKILHISKRKRKPDQEDSRQADDIGACLAAAARGRLGYLQTLRIRPAGLKPVSSDGAVSGHRAALRDSPASLSEEFSDNARHMDQALEAAKGVNPPMEANSARLCHPVAGPAAKYPSGQ